MKYADFVLQISKNHSPARNKGRGYIATVLKSPAGEGGQEIMNDPLAGGRAADLNLQKVGERLYGELFKGRIAELFARSEGLVLGRKNRGLRLKLCFDLTDPEIPKLADLPWELLYKPMTREFICLSERTPVVHHLMVPRPPGMSRLPSALNILVVIADPADDHFPSRFNRLSVAEERRKMEEIARKNPQVTLDFLDRGTRAGLNARLRGERRFHIIHFIGHGALLQGKSCLIFEGENGGPDFVDGESLTSLLRHHKSLGLILLNACDSAKIPLYRRNNPFTGAASSLILAGFPIVLAMRAPVSNLAAITFGDTFYQCLTAGSLIEEAVTYARQAIEATEGASSEWWVPALFMRSESGNSLRFRTLAASLIVLLLAGVSMLIPRPGNRFSVDDPAPGAQIETLDQRVGGHASAQRPYTYLFVEVGDECFSQTAEPIMADSAGRWQATATLSGNPGERAFLAVASEERLDPRLTRIGPSIACSEIPGQTERIHVSVQFEPNYLGGRRFVLP